VAVKLDRVVITKVNEAYIKISSELSVLQELSDLFTFDVPGAKFSPKYKAKFWDGKIRLLSPYTGHLYIGLLPYVKKYCEENDCECVIEFDSTGDAATLEQIEEFAESLKLTARGERIEIRDYQINGIFRAIKHARTLILSPTGSGKSLIIYSLLRWHQDRNRKQLIIVPTISLVSQMFTDFQDYSTENGWIAKDHCVMISGGKEKTNNADVVISTWQSVYELPQSWFEEFDVVYVDECHLAKAKSLTSIMTKCVNSSFRMGTTGTLDGTQTHQMVLEGLFGEVCKITTTKELMSSDHLAELKIKCILLQYTDEEKKLVKKMKEYSEEIDFLISHEKRNKFIRNLALDQKGNTLLLFQRIKHGEDLYALIKEKANDERKIFFVHGGTDGDERNDIRRITENENNAIIVASVGVFSIGVNIRNLSKIVFASPSKSRIRNLQSIGRGLRTAEGKTECILYDIADDLSWKTHKNFTLNHFIERVKIYASESFSYRLFSVTL
jgi:superfamily II DNA or RNA helicase